MVKVKLVKATGEEVVDVEFKDFAEFVEKLRELVESSEFLGTPEVIVKKAKQTIHLQDVEALEEYMPDIVAGTAELILLEPRPKSA